MPQQINNILRIVNAGQLDQDSLRSLPHHDRLSGAKFIQSFAGHLDCLSNDLGPALVEHLFAVSDRGIAGAID